MRNLLMKNLLTKNRFSIMSKLIERLKDFGERRRRLLIGFGVAILLILPTIWFGLGHVIAKQALTVPHGCGLWESNTPTNWTVEDDWESFEPWPGLP